MKITKLISYSENWKMTYAREKFFTDLSVPNPRRVLGKLSPQWGLGGWLTNQSSVGLNHINIQSVWSAIRHLLCTPCKSGAAISTDPYNFSPNLGKYFGKWLFNYLPPKESVFDQYPARFTHSCNGPASNKIFKT